MALTTPTSRASRIGSSSSRPSSNIVTNSGGDLQQQQQQQQQQQPIHCGTTTPSRRTTRANTTGNSTSSGSASMMAIHNRNGNASPAMASSNSASSAANASQASSSSPSKGIMKKMLMKTPLMGSGGASHNNNSNNNTPKKSPPSSSSSTNSKHELKLSLSDDDLQQSNLRPHSSYHKHYRKKRYHSSTTWTSAGTLCLLKAQNRHGRKTFWTFMTLVLVVVPMFLMQQVRVHIRKRRGGLRGYTAEQLALFHGFVARPRVLGYYPDPLVKSKKSMQQNQTAGRSRGVPTTSVPVPVVHHVQHQTLDHKTHSHTHKKPHKDNSHQKKEHKHSQEGSPLYEPERNRIISYEQPKKSRARLPEPWEDEECGAMRWWQTKTFLTCNSLHEYDLKSDLQGRRIGQEKADEYYGSVDAKVINHGYFRDVWMITDTDGVTKRALKTLRFKQEPDPFNYDRHRRDAVAAERLTSSPHIVDLYGFCGNSGFFEYATGGDMNDAIWRDTNAESKHGDPVPPLSSYEKLKMAAQGSIGIMVTHNVEVDGEAAMAHTDVSPGQFILIDGVYKLNDFNRVRFIRKNRKTGEACTYTVGNNPGDFRSPEEYRYDGQTEKVDVYSFGNVLYVLLTARWPFEIEDTSSDRIKEMVMAGERPTVPDDILHSKDEVTQTLLSAMRMCHVQDVEERASSKEVSDFLVKMLAEYERKYPEKIVPFLGGGR